ncbi:hypothetical protein [Amycolatopsis saalfeldensis]|uniref:Secreted protein n=1 Tax=Amycolatopsis saalfeldensis TaxID=394193 RepID=A0A1H8YNT9_9PSEU|nr:hypothetical protein [Amycolatopsis saalfeldensis]SEP53875.1 hypothetical protein SAMN04489732_13256 [Amycolatopsis saalfeldensis]
MKKTLGRLAGAVLAGALISLAVTPSAMADDSAPVVTTSEAAPPASDAPVTDTPSSEPSTGQSTSDTPTSAGQPTDTGTPTGKPTGTGGPTSSGEPTKPTSSQPETTTPEEPYQDDIAYGVDLDGGQGIFVIACAAGEPTGVSSNDFDLVEGPHQDETDGRYWAWLVKRHDGASFDAGNVTAFWTCGGDKGGEQPVPPAGGAGAGSAGTTGGHGDSQVKYAPKGGVETGFGGMAA